MKVGRGTKRLELMADYAHVALQREKRTIDRQQSVFGCRYEYNFQFGWYVGRKTFTTLSSSWAT